jgi:hypothetical protein
MQTALRFLQGRWHRYFGHPPGCLKVKDSVGGEGVHKATFFCRECQRHFTKVI